MPVRRRRPSSVIIHPAKKTTTPKAAQPAEKKPEEPQKGGLPEAAPRMKAVPEKREQVTRQPEVVQLRTAEQPEAEREMKAALPQIPA